MIRRSYGKDFKNEAVKLVLDDDMFVAAFAKELSVLYNMLYH